MIDEQRFLHKFPSLVNPVESIVLLNKLPFYHRDYGLEQRGSFTVGTKQIVYIHVVTRLLTCF